MSICAKHLAQTAITATMELGKENNAPQLEVAMRLASEAARLCGGLLPEIKGAELEDFTSNVFIKPLIDGQEGVGILVIDEKDLQ